MDNVYPETGPAVNSHALSSTEKVANITAHVPRVGVIRNSGLLLAIMEQICLVCRKKAFYCKPRTYLVKNAKVKGRTYSIASIDRCVSRLRDIGAIEVTYYPGQAAEISPLMTVPECRKLLEDLAVPQHVLDRQGAIDETALRSEGFIYLIKSGDAYKIGRTKRFTQRILAIQTSNPDEVEYIASYRTGDVVHSENHWHLRFNSQHIRGEWFNLTTEQLEEFKNHCAKKESE